MVSSHRMSAPCAGPSSNRPECTVGAGPTENAATISAPVSANTIASAPMTGCPALPLILPTRFIEILSLIEENCSLTPRFSHSRRRLVDLYKVVMEQFLPLVVAIVNGLRAPRSNKKRTPTRQKQEDFDLRGRYENSICRSGP